MKIYSILRETYHNNYLSCNEYLHFTSKEEQLRVIELIKNTQINDNEYVCYFYDEYFEVKSISTKWNYRYFIVDEYNIFDKIDESHEDFLNFL